MLLFSRVFFLPKWLLSLLAAVAAAWAAGWRDGGIGRHFLTPNAFESHVAWRREALAVEKKCLIKNPPSPPSHSRYSEDCCSK